MTRRNRLGTMAVLIGVLWGAAPDVRADDCDNRFERIAKDIVGEAKAQLRKKGLISIAGEFPGWEKVSASAAGMKFDLHKDMVGWWNNMAKGGWANIGPRHMSPEPEKGELVGLGDRTWIGTAPMMTKNTLTIKKRDGKLKTRVTVCLGNEKGDVRRLFEHTFEGKDKEATWSKSITEPGSVVFVKLDGREPTFDKFEYTIQMDEEPLKVDTGTVDGFADLHLHQMSEYGNGEWLHGSHKGNPALVLLPCTDVKHIIKSTISSLFSDEGKVHLGLGYPSFKQWPNYDDVGHQQVHETWLKQAHQGGLSLIVMCAVNNEPFAIIQGKRGNAVRDMPCIRKQIEAAHAFDKASDWYEIVYTPWHARKVIHEKKLAVVLSVECSHLFPADEGHFTDQLAKLREIGVRSLQIAHETDSKFSGAAPHRFQFRVENWFKDLVHPEDEIKQLFDKDKITIGYDIDKNTGLNKLGLTKNGKELIDALMDSSMLIDTAHMSWAAAEDTFTIAKRRDFYPLYCSHTRFYELLTDEIKTRNGELCTRKSDLDVFRRTGGILGLRPGPEEMHPFKDKESGRILIPPKTHGSVESFAQQVQYADANGVAIAYGTDMNGMAPQAAPRKESSMSTDKDYREKGLAHIGLLPSFHEDLLSLKANGADRIHQSAEAFLRMWERAYERKGEASNASRTVSR